MLSKSDYAKLSAAGKRKLKAATTGGAGGPSRTMVSGRGAYKTKQMARVPRPIGRVRGRGGYASDIGGTLGGALGGLVPLPGVGALGKWAGSKLGGYIGKLFGSGAYKMPTYGVSKNSLMLDEGNPVPQFGSSGHGTVVAHREYLQDISGTTAFAVASYPINVGLEGSFPWLSQVAANYEEYVIDGIVFEFVSTSADALNSTNTALGSVIMATEYNAAAANFVNKQQMLEYEFSTSGRPSENQCHIVECARRETVISELYVRIGAVPSGQDQRLFDLGNFQIATVGMQAAAVIGELWVTYKIRLIKPKLIGGPFGGTVNYANYYATAGVSASAYFGTSSAASTGTTMTLTLAATTCTFPATLVEGSYVVTYIVNGSSTASLTIPTIAYTTNCAALTISAANTTDQSATSTSLVYIFGLKITGASAVFTFSSGTLPTSATAMELLIAQIPSANV